MEKHLRRKDVENGIHCHQLPGMETQEVTLEVMFRAAFKKLLLLVTKTEWKGKCDTWYSDCESVTVKLTKIEIIDEVLAVSKEKIATGEEIAK